MSEAFFCILLNRVFDLLLIILNIYQDDIIQINVSMDYEVKSSKFPELITKCSFVLTLYEYFHNTYLLYLVIFMCSMFLRRLKIELN